MLYLGWSISQPLNQSMNLCFITVLCCFFLWPTGAMLNNNLWLIEYISVWNKLKWCLESFHFPTRDEWNVCTLWLCSQQQPALHRPSPPDLPLPVRLVSHLVALQDNAYHRQPSAMVDLTVRISQMRPIVVSPSYLHSFCILIVQLMCVSNR
jgi:hypothetical protein